MKLCKEMMLFCTLLFFVCTISVAGPWIVKSSDTNLDTRGYMSLLADTDAGIDSRSYDEEFSSEIYLDTRINVGTVILFR